MKKKKDTYEKLLAKFKQADFEHKMLSLLSASVDGRLRQVLHSIKNLQIEVNCFADEVNTRANKGFIKAQRLYQQAQKVKPKKLRPKK